MRNLRNHKRGRHLVKGAENRGPVVAAPGPPLWRAQGVAFYGTPKAPTHAGSIERCVGKRVGCRWESLGAAPILAVPTITICWERRPGVKHQYTAEQEAFRQEVIQFLKKELPADWPKRADGPGVGRLDAPEYDVDDETEAFRQQITRKVADKGWLTMAWPVENGGKGATYMEQFIFNEAMALYGAPNLGARAVNMLAPPLSIFGTEEQKAEHLPGIASAKDRWAFGYSEPNAGSDLANVETRAVRDGDEFVINGTKIWSSGAHKADKLGVLARTGNNEAKHRGLTYFLIEKKQVASGLTILPLVNMYGQHGFNQIFFDDVRVPASCILGEENRGWYVTMTFFDFERSNIGNVAGIRRVLNNLAGYCRETRRNGARIIDDVTVRNRLAERAIEVEVATYLSYAVIDQQSRGLIPGAEASAVKIYSTELSQRVSYTGTEIVGSLAHLRPESRRSVLYGTYSHPPVSATIAGGTSEIHRNVLATRGLGLPRS